MILSPLAEILSFPSACFIQNLKMKKDQSNQKQNQYFFSKGLFWINPDIVMCVTLQNIIT